jgi:hypothetical protein
MKQKTQTPDPALNALVKKGILTEKEAKDAPAAAEADFKKKPGPDVQVSWNAMVDRGVTDGVAHIFQGRWAIDS